MILDTFEDTYDLNYLTGINHDQKNLAWYYDTEKNTLRLFGPLIDIFQLQFITLNKGVPLIIDFISVFKKRSDQGLSELLEFFVYCDEPIHIKNCPNWLLLDFLGTRGEIFIEKMQVDSFFDQIYCSSCLKSELFLFQTKEVLEDGRKFLDQLPKCSACKKRMLPRSLKNLSITDLQLVYHVNFLRKIKDLLNVFDNLESIKDRLITTFKQLNKPSILLNSYSFIVVISLVEFIDSYVFFLQGSGW